MMNSNVINIFERVFNDMFSYIDLSHKFMCEVPASSLNSSEEVNTLVGISGDMEGNIMFGYTPKIAKYIVAKMTGVQTVNEIDFYAKGALADFFSEFCKLFVAQLKKEATFDSEGGTVSKTYTLLSANPTYIEGKEMFGVISKVPSKKLFFKVSGEKFGIAYYLE